MTRLAKADETGRIAENPGKNETVARKAGWY
jgi:hypothetical protein